MKELSLQNCRLDKRYDLRNSLGRGSYAEIFLAEDILASPGAAHRQVVIKALNVFLQDDLDPGLERTLVENFQNEALALDRVRHPNIISRLGHGTARDLEGAVFHYLVLEYLSGGNLQTLVRNSKLDIGTALGLIEQVCAGLGHAHARGVIHRDIKPQNLLLTSDKRTVKIADFGVARFSVSDSPITRVGTNIYAPPEHSPLSAGRTGELGTMSLTPSADVYSLAKTAFTLITGEAPRGFINEQITSLPDLVRAKPWSRDLLHVLRKATTRDPGQRHASVEEFWDDLQEVRRIALDGDNADLVSEKLPKPHISAGYSPLPPAAPAFESDPKVNPPAGNLILEADPGRAPVLTVDIPKKTQEVFPQIAQNQRGGPSKRIATFLVFLGIFTGLLYGTASYMRGRGVLPEFGSMFGSKVAIANTDIYLRPSPNTDNDPIGLVTKNSKVRIVNSQNNWYQVDVIEEGRTRSSQAGASRGWLNGKYLDINNN